MVRESKLPLLLMKPKENVTSFAGVPSWMLVLMNKMLEETGKGTCLKFGQTEVYFHGVNFEPYREQ
jgi:hypothetical protein